MSALCECGCGELAPLAPHSLQSKGWVRGEPLRFVHGHNARKPIESMYRVDENGCWIWLGGRTGLGRHGCVYGRIKRDGRMQPAHRWFYEQRYGPVSPELEVHHVCEVPLCVNPDHLEPVTHIENNRRRRATKLTAEAVEEIRAVHRRLLPPGRKRVPDGRRIRVELGAKYGVSADQIKQIWGGHRWAQ